jgi:Mrp family chromosome partitioning ATPase
MLSSESMKQLLATLSAQFDYVVIDSPPFLAASDSLVLSTEVDGVLLVAQASRTRRKELKQVVDQLRAIDANIIGVVLNRMKMTDTGYYYRYYDYYRRPDTPSEMIGGNGQDPEGSAPKSTRFGRFRKKTNKSDRA